MTPKGKRSGAKRDFMQVARGIIGLPFGSFFSPISALIIRLEGASAYKQRKFSGIGHCGFLWHACTQKIDCPGYSLRWKMPGQMSHLPSAHCTEMEVRTDGSWPGSNRVYCTEFKRDGPNAECRQAGPPRPLGSRAYWHSRS